MRFASLEAFVAAASKLGFDVNLTGNDAVLVAERADVSFEARIVRNEVLVSGPGSDVFFATSSTAPTTKPAALFASLFPKQTAFAH